MRRRRRSFSAVPTFINSFSSFNDLTGLTNPHWITTAVGGGLIAQFPPAAGTADIPFDHPLSVNEPTIFGVRMEYNGDAAAATLQLVNPLEPDYAGIVFQVNSGTGLKATRGVNNTFIVKANLANGQKFWMGVCWDGTPNSNVIVFCIPETHKGFLPFSFEGSVLLDTKIPTSKVATGGGPNNPLSFNNLTKAFISTTSATNKILSVFVRQGNNQGGTLPRVEPPILLNSTLNGDTTALIRAKYGYTGVGQRDAIILFHGANSSEEYGSDSTAYDNGVAIAHLVQNSYITALMRGTDDFSETTYSGPKASNWGHESSLDTWWKALHTKLLTEFDIRNIYLIGMSMGLLNALNFYARYPTGIKGIIGVSGVCNLSYAYNSEGFAAVIDAAHGGAPDLATHDPNLRAALYTGVPIKLWHGDADVTVHKANHADTFAASVNALAPGTVEVVSVAGGGHLTANMFDGPAMLTFLQAHI